MKFFKTLLVAALSLCVAEVMKAQSIRWSVLPEYDEIQQVSEKLYRVTTVKGVGLVMANGSEVIAPGNADKISDFSEDGLAIVMKAENGNYRLAGIVSDRGNLLIPPGEFYLGDYSFFSEGMLPVQNKKGQYGYMDKEGGLAIECKYTSAYPFCQGYAVVGTGLSLKIGTWNPFESKEPFTYIDKNGIELSLDKSLGKIYFGSSFYNDVATVKSKKGEFCTIGLNGKVIEKGVKPNLKFDWKYRLSDEKQPEGFEVAKVTNGPITFHENGKFGYMIGSRRILAAQFEEAAPFFDRYAVAKVRSGETGILELVDGTVSCTIERGTMEVTEKDMECVLLIVNLPDSFRDEEIVVRVYGEDHDTVLNSSSLSGLGTTQRTAQLILPSFTHFVTVSCKGLVIYQGLFESLGPEAFISVTAFVTAEKADLQKKQPFSVVFTNSGKQDVKFQVSITGKNVTATKKTILVKSGKKASVASAFVDVTKVETRTITIKYGDEVVTKSMTVKSIFD